MGNNAIHSSFSKVYSISATNDPVHQYNATIHGYDTLEKCFVGARITEKKYVDEESAVYKDSQVPKRTQKLEKCLGKGASRVPWYKIKRPKASEVAKKIKKRIKMWIPKLPQDKRRNPKGCLGPLGNLAKS